MTLSDLDIYSPVEVLFGTVATLNLDIARRGVDLYHAVRMFEKQLRFLAIDRPVVNTPSDADADFSASYDRPEEA